MQVHPVANIFPRMAAAEFAELVADIAEHGQREPVWTHNGMLIDGRHRWDACEKLGLPCHSREYDGNDALGFVVSLNLRRRHLSESQRSVVAGKLANLSHGGDRKSDQAANLQLDPVTQADAAGMLNVSPRSVASAVKVLAEAPQEVIEAVTSGAMSVSLASEVVELPPEDIEAIAAAPVDERRDVAREAVKRAHVANNSGNNEWYTPLDIIARARMVMGDIDLDPASSEVANRTVQAAKYYTAEDNGLAQPWHGRVWMNPPYAQPLMADFAEAVSSKYANQEIEQACVLVNNGTETQWFQRMLQVADAVCFPRGRIRFVDPEGKPSGAPLQGQAILYFGNNIAAFAAHFRECGRVCQVFSDLDQIEAGRIVEALGV